MWWLLIPVVGAVIAAVVNSDDDDKETVERRARLKAREAAEARVKAEARQAELKHRHQQLIAGVTGELMQLYENHRERITRPSAPPIDASITTLQAFVDSKTPSTPKLLLKTLDTLAPGTTFSPDWLAQEAQAKALRKDIASLKRLKTELRR